MTDYDFFNLNDKEFEILVNDLLSLHFNTRIERFKSGKDGGVDGRFFKTKDEIIIQTKHWLKSGISSLINYTKKTELTRVKKIHPKRYIFVTSLQLSRTNKSKIKSTFDPYILSESDIFGQEDLNDLIRKFPEIEKTHYKLWLASTNVIQLILNSGIIGRSGFALEKIQTDSSKYVISDNHTKSLEKLEKLHSIIITGVPGIGKTTLADQLSLNYAGQGFEFVFITDIREAEDLFRVGKKQLFYYDDFLGRNFLLALERNQDSKVVNFIKRISKDSKKRFILTSRTNILNQGKRLSDLFEIEKVDRNEFEVQISFLTDLEKAKILYNHIWFGALSDEYFDELVTEKRYLKIIRHKNFNPRIISFITDNYKISSIDKGDYWQYVQNTLDKPKDIWSNAIEIQTDDECRHVLIGVVIYGTSIEEKDLFEFINRLRNNYSLISNSKTNESLVKLLVGALLNRNLIYGVRYDLFNPSIADYIIATYLTDYRYIAKIISCLNSSQPLSNLKSLYTSKSITFDFYKKCLTEVFMNLKITNDQNLQSIFCIELIILLINSKIAPNGFNALIESQINHFIEETLQPDNYDHLSLLEYATENEWIKDEEQLLSHVCEYLEHEYLDWDCLIKVSDILRLIDQEEKLKDLLKKCVDSELSDNLKDMVIEQGLYSDLYTSDYIDATDLYDFIEEQLAQVNVDFNQEEISSIADSFDFDYVIDYNIKTSSREGDEYEYHRSRDSNNDQDISDLFERN